MHENHSKGGDEQRQRAVGERDESFGFQLRLRVRFDTVRPAQIRREDIVACVYFGIVHINAIACFGQLKIAERQVKGNVFESFLNTTRTTSSISDRSDDCCQ